MHCFAGGDAAEVSDSAAESNTEVLDTVTDATEDSVEDFEKELDELDSDALSEDLDDNSLDFPFDDDSGGLSDLEDTPTEALENTVAEEMEIDEDELEESSTAILEEGLDLDAPEDATQAFDLHADAEVSELQADSAQDDSER